MPLPIPPALLLIAAVSASAPGPTVAREDTLSTEVNPVLVRAPRVTLSEILDRVARGEARRDSMIQDQSFRVTMRMLRNTVGKHPPTLMQETVFQVYHKRPDRLRTIKLREWHEKTKKGDKEEKGETIDLGDDFGEDIVNFAFKPNSRREFSYRIAGRDIVGNHLIYRIAFQPRSPLDPTLPGGLVWIDTNDFVIVRQEVSLERSPMPAILKGIDRMVVERQRVGDLWVLKRVLMRLELAFPLPKIGRAFDIGLFYDNYVTNQGLPDSLFAQGRKTPEVSH